MDDILLGVTRFAMLAFLLASMLELGLSLTLGQVLAPLKDARLVMLSLLANFVIAPLIAFGLASALRLDQPFAIGLLLLGLAPGAPFIPKLTQLARGDLAFSAALMVLLVAGTIVYLPLVLPRMLAGAEIDAWMIGRSLFLLLLLPLGIGLFIRASFPSLPAWPRRSLGVLSNLSALVVLALIVTLNFKSVLDVFGTGAIFAGFCLVVLSALTGWLLGGSNPGIRAVLALGTGSRNVGAALLVGAQEFKDHRVNVMVTVSALVSLLVLLPTARALGKRAARSSGAESIQGSQRA